LVLIEPYPNADGSDWLPISRINNSNNQQPLVIISVWVEAMIDERNPGAINYFDRRIDNFDDIYKRDRKGMMAWLDKTLRASVRERFDLAFELLGDMTGKSVIDIGCGSGRYMFEAVQRGASDVVGLDAASGALEAARKMATKLGMEKKVQFIESDFLDLKIERKFDVVFAVGYFDYILTPQAHLEKMLKLSNHFFFASFPRLWHPLTPIRKTRLALNHCPVRFYSKTRIADMIRQAGQADYELRIVSRDFTLIVNK
jgi:2-polyprenyl-3-methyl-5-hydroxy-6-metoxy-1,4-benzoquinol methylase